MRALLAVALLPTLAACTTPPPDGRASPGSSQAAPDAPAVIQAAQALFSGMESRDTAALRRLFSPDARVVSMRIQSGADAVVQTRSVSDFVASIGRSTDRLRERMWGPQVEIEGDMATLWAPYDFHLGER